jgi:cobalt-zinc-cadmium efflux system protein
MKAASTHHAHHCDGNNHRYSARHTHAPQDFGVAFAIGTVLNLGFVILETVYGLLSNSLALVSDAGHNFGDVLSLVMAWAATVLARRAPSQTHTYGLRRGTILAALANAMLLMVAVGAIAVEGARRLLEPGEVAGMTVIVVATAGIVVNGMTAWVFAAGRKGDVNLRAAFLHMAYDALVSLGVVVTGAVIILTGWTRLDPLASLAIAVIILVGTWSLLRESVGMSLDAVPVGIATEEVGSFIKRQPGVSAIHDLHVWPISTTETALSCHCLMQAAIPGMNFS